MHAVFVYGTLRPGGHNHRLLESVPRLETAYAHGLALYDGPGFPYAAPTRAGRITGVLCSISDAEWPATLRSLDTLEGYDSDRESLSHYLRRRWPVVTDIGAQTEAWVYLAGPRVDLGAYARIASGDWLSHSTINHRSRS